MAPSGPVRVRLAARAVAPKENLVADDAMTKTLRLGQADLFLAEREHIVELAAAQAHEVVVPALGVRIVPGRASTRRDLLDFPLRRQVVQGVVDGGKTDLGEQTPSPFEDLLGGQMDVFPFQDLSDDATLRRHAPGPPAEPLEQGA